MQCGHLIPLVAGLVLAVGHPARAQYPSPSVAAAAPRFESWRPVSPLDSSSVLTASGLVAASRDRGDRALLGGVIGAAAGVVVCTAISTLIDDSADRGLSFCPLDTYLLFAAGGFVLGAGIGLLL